MKKKLRGIILAIATAMLFGGYCVSVQAHPADSTKTPLSGFYTGKTDCAHLKTELNALKSQEYQLKTSLMPQRLHLARTASFTGLNGSKADELSSQLTRVRQDKVAVFQMLESRGCR
ncbi:MAG: hypothetical protein ACP5IL_12375 [Syntrophobacteraceae bacterium]